MFARAEKKKNDVDLPPQRVWFPIPSRHPFPASSSPSPSCYTVPIRYYVSVFEGRTAPVAYNFNLLRFNQRYVPIIQPTAFSRSSDYPGKLDGYECRVFASSTYWIRLSDMLPITRNVYWRNQDRGATRLRLPLFTLSFRWTIVSEGRTLDLKLIIFF